MAARPPTLRRHVRGLWIAKWGGRTWYFTADQRESERLFLAPDSDHPGSLAAWARWKSSKATAVERANAYTLTVAELYLRFDAHLHAEQLHDERTYYRKHLRRFANVFGAFAVHEVDEAALDAFRQDLLAQTPRLAPATIRHDLKAVKRLWRWGSGPTVRLCPPLMLDAVKTPRVRKGEPEDLPLEEIIGSIDRAGRRNPALVPWLSLNYLAALRPSEVVRLAHGQGRLVTIPREGELPPVREGAVVLSEHKMANRTEHERLIPLSQEALIHYRSLAPLPLQRRRSRTKPPPPGRERLDIPYLQNRYALAARRAGVPGLPHKLRDSAASHLLAEGVDPATVDLILGHAPSAELPRYGRASLRVLRETAARLSLRPAPSRG